MLVSSSWCSVGIFLYFFYILPLLPRNSNWMLQCFLNMVNPCPVLFVDDLEDVYVVCLPSCLVPKCLCEAGGKGRAPVFLG